MVSYTKVGSHAIESAYHFLVPWPELISPALGVLAMFVHRAYMTPQKFHKAPPLIAFL
jgi:hypothetical protein